MRIARMALLLLAAAGLVQLLHSYPLLPERMASHFDGSGQPNGFQSKQDFAALSASMLLLTAVLFGGMGALLRKVPSNWFNLPNRDYWLAPERREETIDAISVQMEWFGAASLGLYLYIIQMVIETNRTPAPNLDVRSAWVVFGLYLAFTAVWITRFVLRFRR